MNPKAKDQLAAKRCSPCESGTKPYDLRQAQAQLQALQGWRLTHEGKRIRKDWVVKNFIAGVAFLDRVAELAEAEGHHPDLHLEGYRKLWVETWTHSISGLSDNDFILAAKIDTLPIELTAAR